MTMFKEIILRVIRELNEPRVFPFILLSYTPIVAAVYMLANFRNYVRYYPLFFILFILPLLIRFHIIEICLTPKKEIKVKSPVLDELADLIRNSGRELRIITLDLEKSKIMIAPFKRLLVTSGFLNSFGNNLSEDEKKELKAIMGHETTHLEQLNRRVIEIVLAVSILITIFLFLPLKLSTVYHILAFYSSVFFSIYLVIFLVSRRHEYRADAGSLLKGNYAEYLIKGLIRVEGNLDKMSLLDKINEIFYHRPHQLNRIKKIKKLEETMRAGSKA